MQRNQKQMKTASPSRLFAGLSVHRAVAPGTKSIANSWVSGGCATSQTRSRYLLLLLDDTYYPKTKLREKPISCECIVEDPAGQHVCGNQWSKMWFKVDGKYHCESCHERVSPAPTMARREPKTSKVKPRKKKKTEEASTVTAKPSSEPTDTA